SLVTTCASHPRPARRTLRTTASPPAAAAQPAAHMALIPACKGMYGVKPSPATTCASHPTRARRPPQTISSPPAVASDSWDCNFKGSVALPVVTVRGFLRGGCCCGRRVKPARPYICLLIILVLVLMPSVRPL